MAEIRSSPSTKIWNVCDPRKTLLGRCAGCLTIVKVLPEAFCSSSACQREVTGLTFSIDPGPTAELTGRKSKYVPRVKRYSTVVVCNRCETAVECSEFADHRILLKSKVW